MPQNESIVRVQHMLDYAREAVDLARGRTRADLDSDRLFNLALVRLLEVVGEAASKVATEFRALHPQVAWRGIVNLRNRLIHEYDEVDFNLLWLIVQDNAPALIAQLEAVIAGNGGRARASS